MRYLQTELDTATTLVVLAATANGMVAANPNASEADRRQATARFHAAQDRLKAAREALYAECNAAMGLECVHA